MQQTEQINELAAALAKAQAEMQAAPKSKLNPHFKSKYADLDSCWDAARGPLSRNGLSVSQWPETEGKAVTIVTTLLHASGQWQSGKLTMAARDETPQSIGSTITYGRRYGFCAAVGITSDEDDDGNASSGRDGAKAAPPAQRAVQKPAEGPKAAAPAGAPNVYDGTPAHKTKLREVVRAVGINDAKVLAKVLPMIHQAFLEAQIDLGLMDAGVREFMNANFPKS